jgi:small subunit ribosomal protein S1
MAKLMAKHAGKTKALKKGESIEGKLTKVSKQEILMDVHGKSEALVIEREKNILNSMLSSLKVGDTVTATIISPESETGQPIVSIRRFMEERNWKKFGELQKGNKSIEVTVTDVTKGGLVVQTQEGLHGFLPQSHMAPGLSAQPGAKISVYLLELNRPDNKLIVTQKETLTDEDFKTLTKDLKTGQKIDSNVVSITPFGLFISLPTSGNEKVKQLDGLIHISEVSWDKVDDLQALFTVGQEVSAQIIGIDVKSKRVDLSIKRLTEDPFAKISEMYPVDSRAKGIVTKLEDGNVYVTIDGTIEGIIRKEKVPMNTNYEVGQPINVTIAEIDTRRHRILLAPVLLEKPIGYR